MVEAGKSAFLFQAAAHGGFGGLMNVIEGQNFGAGFASGVVSSLISSEFQSIKNIGKDLRNALTIASGGLSGGISSTIAGGNFWAGARQGLIISGLNHVAHSVAGSLKKKASWDLNGDDEMSKLEADAHWLFGGGEDVILDNSKIDWTGLEMDLRTPIGDEFSISTTGAFDKLPLKTAASFGGTRFRRTGKNTAEVLNQRYHYDLRPFNNIENFARNIMNEIGNPQTYTRAKGIDFMIIYKNPTINFNVVNHIYTYRYIYLPNGDKLQWNKKYKNTIYSIE